MKKLVFGLIATVMFGFAGNAQERLTTKDLEFVGIEHNLIFEKYFLTIREIDNTDLQKYSESFFLNEISLLKIKDDDKKVAFDRINIALKTIPNYDETLYQNVKENYIFKDNMKKYLNQVHDLVYNYDNDLKYTTLEIEKIEKNIANDVDLNNVDLSIIYSATNVAKYSLSYWTDNIDIWSNHLNSSNTTSNFARGKTPGRRIGEIAVADVGGAVGGALGAYAVNVWIGPGQVAYAGAILGGAVSCSAAAAVYHLAASIFQWD